MDGMNSVRWLEGHVTWTFEPSTPEERSRLAGAVRDGTLGRVAVRGSGGGLPSEAATRSLGIDVCTDKAVLVASTEPLPLAGLAIQAAVCRHAPADRAIDTVWELDLSGPGEERWTVRGRWLLLAQLGYLGGWPEPTHQAPP
ncbi:MAG: hypothetical protein WAV45_01345 [Propionibacteriaceae bacterium]|nr:hypothetical protein [Propionibacteriaceae bacterium]